MARDSLKLKNKTLIIGYASAISASALFGSVPTIAKPIVSNVNVLLLSALVYLIAALAFTPIAQKSKTSFARKDYWILITVAICGATVCTFALFSWLEPKYGIRYLAFIKRRDCIYGIACFNFL